MKLQFFVFFYHVLYFSVSLQYTLICHSNELVGISYWSHGTSPLSYWCMMTILLQYVSVSPGLLRLGNLYTICYVSYYTGFHVHVHMFFTTDQYTNGLIGTSFTNVVPTTLLGYSHLKYVPVVTSYWSDISTPHGNCTVQSN